MNEHAFTARTKVACVSFAEILASGYEDESNGLVRPDDVLAAVDFHGQMQEEERYVRRALQVDDVSAPQLISHLGDEFVTTIGSYLSGVRAARQQCLLARHAVGPRIQSETQAAVGMARDDLLERVVVELGRVGRHDDAPALSLDPLVHLDVARFGSAVFASGFISLAGHGAR